MASTFTSYAFVASISFVLWRIIRRFASNSTLSRLPGPPRESFLTGNFNQLFNVDGWKFHLDLVKNYGSASLVHLFAGDKMLYIIDPLALHHIFIKDQHIYEKSDQLLQLNEMTFGRSLLSTVGKDHRKQRKSLNPVFSLKHMRGLISTFYPIAHQVRDIIVQKVQKGECEIDVMEWMSRAALEYIAQGGLGHTFNALSEDDQDEFVTAINMIVPTEASLFMLRQLLPFINQFGSANFRRKLVEWTPSRRVQRAKYLIDVLDRTSRQIYDKKIDAIRQGDKATLDQIGSGKDILSILLRANLETPNEDRLAEDEILGQIGTFVFAGADTTTSALCHVLHLLAVNPGVQDKLRQEVTTARQDRGDLDYDDLMGLPFLDAVCRETLRVYPPVSMAVRTTLEDAVLPLLWPVKSSNGKEEFKEIPLRKGTDIMISILNANRSKAIWGEDAELWKPERWLTSSETTSDVRLPGVYGNMQVMTFIGGGHACIGFKFAELELKLALSILLETFIFSSGSQEVEWMMSMLQQPTVKDSEDKSPRLPLKLTLVKA
ncbi:cytochrome P450 [Schizopora paradoxa]|uniref:Cytochrome P450 n=1 Tax=Schizopora paradoxa TaxID=27342 RepID=A0A0H2RMX6_9AGAM|nr:cytochrome P450 [Schizopora paradoxa]